MPDELNPRVLILRHQRLNQSRQEAMNASMEQVFQDQVNSIDRSAANLVESLNRIQEDRR